MDALSEPVLFDVARGVARIRFNRPAALNAINEPMAQAFLAASREIAQRSDVRVVVMSGEGKGFMAGGDVARMVEAKPDAGVVVDALLDAIEPALLLLAEIPAPVVASVHGAVAGAGLSFMLAADLAIAADDARFALAYSAIGASPDASGSWTLPRVVGVRRALEIALLSDLYTAQEALALGLVNKVVPRAELAAATDALVQRLASGPTQAYGRIKKLVRGLARAHTGAADAARACIVRRMHADVRFQGGDGGVRGESASRYFRASRTEEKAAMATRKSKGEAARQDAEVAEVVGGGEDMGGVSFNNLMKRRDVRGERAGARARVGQALR